MRYLFTEFAENPVAANGRTYQFEKVSWSVGHWLGTVEVDDGEAAGLLAVRGVSEISREDYDKLQAQKKTIPYSGKSPLLNHSPRPVVQQKGPPIPIAEKPGVASAGGNNPPAPKPADAKEFPAVGDVLKIAPVASPQPIVEGDRRVGDAPKRRGRKA